MRETRPVASFRILLVDDEQDVLETFDLMLVSGGFKENILCSDSRTVLSILEKQEVNLLLLDLSMPHISGGELLPRLTRDYPEIPVIILTGINDLETAVDCMRQGAFDYMVKPVEKSRLLSGVKRAQDFIEMRDDYDRLKEKMLSQDLERPESFSRVVTRSPQMLSIFKYVELIAPTSKPVLVTGETGVGKEPIVKVIHDLSNSSGQFIAVNVAGLDDTSISDTLFGHKKGAFTGAQEARAGLIEKAEGGTLFLDEIGDLSNQSQLKLLRLLQENEYLPLGSDMVRLSRARIITATNKGIEELKASGNFRKDLFYRLSAHHIHIPPLRERLADIPLLVDYFLDEAASELDKKRPAVPAQLYTLLENYLYPGNVRELKTMIFDAVNSHSGKILSLDVFKARIGDVSHKDVDEPARERRRSLFYGIGILPTLKEATNQLISEALSRTKGNQSQAARLIGLTQSALSKRLKRSS